MVLKANPKAADDSRSSPLGESGVVANKTVDHDLSPSAIASAAGVSLRSVTKRYGDVTAIENITLDIPAGAYCCLLGPSGCGKTTALRTIAGHEAVTSGDVLIGDRTVTHLPAAQRNTAMMFQNYALFPHKTIWQNVEFGLKMKGIAKAERQRRVDEILELVGLAHTAQRKPDQLSGGQQQRIALARALVNRPQVLMLDEPLSALDENLRVRMRGELRKIQRQFGLTFIQVTHHVEEAFSLSDQIVVMDHGRIEQIATPTELFTTPASQFVAKFIGDNNIFAGKVIDSVPSSNGKDIITLDIEGVGVVTAEGVATENGTSSACSVRPDLIALHSSDNDTNDINQVAARITDVELTGYVTRVILTIETTGQLLLHKVRTTDWAKMLMSVGDSVCVSWAVEDCVFLPY